MRTTFLILSLFFPIQKVLSFQEKYLFEPINIFPTQTQEMIRRAIADGHRDSIGAVVPLLLMSAQIEGNEENVRLFCELSDEEGRTFLQNMVRFDCVQEVEQVVGALGSLRNIDPVLLHFAQSEEMVQLLLTYGSIYNKDLLSNYPCDYANRMQQTHAHYQLVTAYQENNYEKAVRAIGRGASSGGSLKCARSLATRRPIRGELVEKQAMQFEQWVSTQLLKQACRENNLKGLKRAVKEGASVNCRIGGVHTLIWLLQRKRYALAEHVVFGDLKLWFNHKDYVKLKSLRDPRAKELVSFLV